MNNEWFICQKRKKEKTVSYLQENKVGEETSNIGSIFTCAHANFDSIFSQYLMSGTSFKMINILSAR